MPGRDAVRVRNYEPGDFEAVYRLDQACYPPGIAYSRYELRAFLQAPGARAWVADDEAELLGFIVVRKTGRGRGHVITLDIRADRRRQGIGTELLAAAEAWLAAAGVRRVRLETAVDNHPAVAFWRSAGYERVGRLPGYYSGREDAYRMEKELH